MTVLTEGLAAVANLFHVAFTALGVLFGLVLGVIPGLGPLLGIVLASPLSIYLPPATAMGFLIGIYVGGTAGGAISAALLRIPGTPIAAATLLDAYPMAQKGEAPRAVGLAISASSIGGLIGGIALVGFSPLLARFALSFGPPEYFSLGVMGLITVAFVSRGDTIKGLLSAALGIMAATVGLDPFTSYARFTGGGRQLMAGISLVPMLLGAFAISEVLLQVMRGSYLAKPDIPKAFRPPLHTIIETFKSPIALIRSSVLGTAIGALPGTGGVIASFVAYSVGKARSKRGHLYGTGEPEGVITTESANNASCGGALIPSMALSIPGDPTAAVLLGALLLIGFRAGPALFVQHPDMAGGMIISYVASNILLLVLGMALAPMLIAMIRVRRNLLLPIILLLSFLGSYSLSRSLLDVWTMWFFGGLALLLRIAGFPLAPLVIGHVLGPIVEQSFRRALVLSDGDFSVFVTRPVSLTVLLLNAAVLVSIGLGRRRAAVRHASINQQTDGADG